jgi:hypothetical protein
MWAHFVSATQDVILCISVASSVCFPLISDMLPKINVSPTLVKFVSNKSYHYC